MTTYARIVEGMALDVISTDPFETFHPDLAVQFVEVPEGVEHGSVLASTGVWQKPATAEAVIATTYPVLTPPQFQFQLLSMQERIAMRKLASTDAMVADFLRLIDDPRLTEIDLNIGAVRSAVELVVAAIGEAMEPPYTPPQLEERQDAILSGRAV